MNETDSILFWKCCDAFFCFMFLLLVILDLQGFPMHAPAMHARLILLIDLKQQSDKNDNDCAKRLLLVTSMLKKHMFQKLIFNANLVMISEKRHLCEKIEKIVGDFTSFDIFNILKRWNFFQNPSLLRGKLEFFRVLSVSPCPMNNLLTINNMKTQPLRLIRLIIILTKTMQTMIFLVLRCHWNNESTTKHTTTNKKFKTS